MRFSFGSVAARGATPGTGMSALGGGVTIGGPWRPAVSSRSSATLSSPPIRKALAVM